MNRRIAFHTLGCRLNQFETDAITARFKDAGYSVVPYEEEADAYVVNTCTVTAKSDRKSRNIINRARRQRQDAVVVVTGCYVDSARETLERETGLTYIVDNDRKTGIFEMVDSHFRGEMVHPDSLDKDLFSYSASANLSHTRAAVKIQDGCDNFCTFCIIPHVRGRAKSRPIDEIEKHVRELLAIGYKEIVLTGVNISRYDCDGLNFSAVLEKILDIEEDFRLRIPSIEPECLDDRFFTLLDHPKMAPHLHLCLQSGSDKVLLKMRREYSVSDYITIVEKIRQKRPDFNITTDIIVGFPGETDEDFAQTLEIASRAKFGHIHAFPYSMRSGTRAERMNDQVEERIKAERSEKVRILGDKLKLDYRASMLGKTQRVLIEKVHEEGCVTGYSEHYIPVRIDTILPHNSWQQVRITGMEQGGIFLLGETFPPG